MLGVVLLSSCRQPRQEQSTAIAAGVPVVAAVVAPDTAGQSTVTTQPADTVVQSETEFEEYRTFHLVTITEGYNYDSLRRVADAVAGQLGTQIDSLGRMYDPGKGIVLPPDDADEMYRGQYYPRRFAAPSVSIEMQYAYADAAQPDTVRMVLIAGIFEQKQQADSVLALVKPLHPGADVISRELFTGCIH
jgi:hypothetical protein